MIDDRFSKQVFEQLGWNTEDSRVLCGQLDAEIHALLMERLKPAVRDVVKSLNAMGHNLLDVSQELNDDIHYREAIETDAQWSYTMLLAADLVITVGYPQSQRFSAPDVNEE